MNLRTNLFDFHILWFSVKILSYTLILPIS